MEDEVCYVIDNVMFLSSGYDVDIMTAEIAAFNDLLQDTDVAVDSVEAKAGRFLDSFFSEECDGDEHWTG